MAEMLVNRARCTVMALSLNVVFGVLGGLTPLVALYLIRRKMDDLSPACQPMAAALVLAALRPPGMLASALPEDLGPATPCSAARS